MSETSTLPAPDGRPFDEVRTPWKAWTPSEVARHLEGVRTGDGQRPRWAVAGGWAVDLFVGRVTREHEDVEIVVLADDVPAVLAAFPGPDWRWEVPTEGWLHPLDSAAFEESHQTWLWSRSEAAFVLDVFRDQHDRDTWICRRDPTIRLPWSALVRTSAEGIPHLPPEIVLLFKAKHARAKDVADLHAVLPLLESGERAWLSAVLERVHPGHDWQGHLH